MTTDQAQSVYAAEDLWEAKEPRARTRFGDWNEVWPFYYTLTQRLNAAEPPGGATYRPPGVKPRRGALKAHYDAATATVYLPPYASGGAWALNTATAIHEYAHHLAPNSGHGPDFRAAMIQCIEVLGWDADLLTECYANVGLSTSDKADGITDKVNKLLIHADKAGTPEEQKTYLEKAEGLAAEHSISLALLRKKQADAEDKDRDRPTTGAQFNLMALPNVTYRNLAVELCSAVASAHGVQLTIRGKSANVTFYGFQEDITLTELMVTRVTPMMFDAADTYLKSAEHKSSGVATVSARITFCKHFAWEVGARLKEAVRQTETRVQETLGITDGSTSTALALKEKKVEVADYVAHEFKRIGVRGSWSGSRTNNWSGRAADAGQSAAQNANLFGMKEIGA